MKKYRHLLPEFFITFISTWIIIIIIFGLLTSGAPIQLIYANESNTYTINKNTFLSIHPIGKKYTNNHKYMIIIYSTSKAHPENISIENCSVTNTKWKKVSDKMWFTKFESPHQCKFQKVYVNRIRVHNTDQHSLKTVKFFGALTLLILVLLTGVFSIPIFMILMKTKVFPL